MDILAADGVAVGFFKAFDEFAEGHFHTAEVVAGVNHLIGLFAKAESFEVSRGLIGASLLSGLILAMVCPIER